MVNLNNVNEVYKTGTVVAKLENIKTPTNGITESHTFSIDNDANFAANALSYGWEGTGDIESPYLIGNYSLSNTSLQTPFIEIKNTASHFRIKNVTIVGGTNGIRFENVSNGHLMNCSISYSSSELIYFSQCENITISDSKIFHTNTLKNCLLIDYSTSINIFNSHIYDSKLNGVKFRDSGNALLSGNSFYNNSHSAISASHCSTLTFQNNKIFDNEEFGLLIEGGTLEVIIQDNLIYNNIGIGVRLAGVTNANISENTFYNNSFFAIRSTEGNADIDVFMNNIIDNFDHHKHVQVAIEGSINFSIYYWSDWTGKDDDNKNIVDDPYTSNPALAVNDESPQVKAYPCEELHILTRPNIIQPVPLWQFSDEVLIEWGISSDTFNHSITYTIHYSSDNGSTWNELIQNLAGVSYTWNVSLLENGILYKIKIIASDGHGLTRTAEMDELFQIYRDEESSNTTSESKRSSGFMLLLSISSIISLTFFMKRRKK